MIDAYFKLLQLRDSYFIDWEPSLFLPVIFYLNLSTRGYKSVARFTTGVDVFRLNQMFIPIHLSDQKTFQ